MLVRRLALLAGIVVLVAVAGGAALALSDDDAGVGAKAPPRGKPRLVAAPDPEADQSFPEPASAGPHPVAESPETAATGISPGAPSDAQVRRDLRQLERYNRGLSRGGSGRIELDAGAAHLRSGAPAAVRRVVSGGNSIAQFPYRFGGGHGSFIDDAYDCSGSVSYALAAGGLLEAPLDSGQLMRWGAPGRGRWITVYANPGHVFMEVGGLRFDTSGRAGLRGSRWQAARRTAGGFTVRHWPGL